MDGQTDRQRERDNQMSNKGRQGQTETRGTDRQTITIEFVS